MAMSLTGSGRGGKNLSCGVCQEVYRSPRLLPCFHTFCLYCLEGLVRTHGRSFPCPQCRKPTPVPPEGALGFQMNFYITEEELERERNGPSTAVCSIHEMEPLVFFCVQCEQAICIRCKLTKHSDHPKTEDLSEAAARSADYLKRSTDRLENAITFLKDTSTLAHENLRAAKRKGVALKQQAQTQHDTLVQKIGSALTTILGQIDSTNSGVEARLTEDAQKIQQELDSLVQLRQSVHHALCAEASDADKVSVEKEMREGKGSEAHLHHIKTNVPTTTARPGLHSASDVFSEDDLRRVVGNPVLLPMPFTASREVTVTIFQDAERGRVYGLCQRNSSSVAVVAADPSSEDKTREITIDEQGNIKNTCLSSKCRNSFKRYEENRCFRSSFEFSDEDEKRAIRLNSKGFRTLMFQVNHFETRRKTSVFGLKIAQPSPEFNVQKHHVLDTNPAAPAAFDATDMGDVFALVEIVSSQSPNERQVCLYRKGQSKPFATYTPQDTHFWPSDVCFWQENDQDKLLVADRQNDCVHVACIREDEVHFERYLAAGDSNLVRPTALNVDDRGRVWIGCENGSVLRCEMRSSESHNEDDEPADDDASQATGSVHGSCDRSLLMVENSSQSADTQSEASENNV